ncbi:uncharacterized protein F4812DRAFT_452166 [Daldinia caldariorum]|uniref:uncharacterized protein n=1 Tax=Daldinia caldariorum TaxID=326644 RepID=UPI002007F289|nr:uncharacterized protein F4812DRAFT_452166 [Daldinia caldariorum]KAI1465624.1 hypothetical protein F4812DRAFT_452166 [Daldinia caldariorum]
MFDVLWTDPNRELVGERMVRKEQEAKMKDKEKKQKPENGRRSISTESSTSSDRGFGIFSTRSRRKAPASPRPKDRTASPATPARSINRTNRASAYAVKNLLIHQDESEITVKPAERDYLPAQVSEAAEVSNSTLSRWTDPSAITNSTGVGASLSDATAGIKSEYLIQTLGPSSFITRTTEVMYSPRDPDADIDPLVSEVHISASRAKVTTPPITDFPERTNSIAFDDPGSTGQSSASPHTPPPVEFQNNSVIYTPGWNGTDRLGNPDAWKPPHEWECTPNRQLATHSDEEGLHNSLISDDSERCMSPSLAALQREVRMMAAATPELMLANIKSSMGYSSDATVYKELEMAKKRWMFSALQHEGYVPLVDCADSCPGSLDSSKPYRPPRILALYETQASASFLAAMHPQALISHLSPKPISPNLFPNVQPLLVPVISASAGSRPLAPQLYSTVTCLPMPALFPSSEIPPLLRHIYRCLTPGGALHLTLIDPQPVSSSMGPKLRQWLFENLLIQLEKKCRTTLPSDTFPAWLAVAKLRGFGSTITTISVRAVHEGAATTEDTNDQTSVENELRCLVSRMLWQEIWGKFVHADRWWWEEEDIVQECIERGTYWQYSHIVAVKNNRQSS